MTAVDIFAGCGGSTTGAKAAGVDVLWAANHWQLAVDTHARNYRGVVHSCQDLCQADFDAVPDHHLALCSPDCRGHTRARGKEKPRHNKYRATAWAVASLLEAKRPSVCVVENVVEFQNWKLYPSWCDALHRLRYSISPHIVDAADHGVPQHRVRLFLVCTLSKSPLSLKLTMLPHLAVDGIIDWSQGEWGRWSGLCKNTRARCRAGRSQFGDRFVAPYYGSGSGLTGRSIHRPIGTLTTKDRYYVVDGDRGRMLSVAECRRAMGFPEGYLLPAVSHDAKFLLGQAVCPPVMTDILNALHKQV